MKCLRFCAGLLARVRVVHPKDPMERRVLVMVTLTVGGAKGNSEPRSRPPCSEPPRPLPQIHDPLSSRRSRHGSTPLRRSPGLESDWLWSSGGEDRE